jgi:esterase/lipase superfamily enzyme
LTNIYARDIIPYKPTNKIGQGAWEDDLLEGTRRMDALLREKHIPVWVDYWGFGVCHDWCWWQKQLPYFFGKIMH